MARLPTRGIPYKRVCRSDCLSYCLSLMTPTGIPAILKPENMSLSSHSEKPVPNQPLRSYITCHCHNVPNVPNVPPALPSYKCSLLNRSASYGNVTPTIKPTCDVDRKGHVKKRRTLLFLVTFRVHFPVRRFRGPLAQQRLSPAA